MTAWWLTASNCPDNFLKDAGYLLSETVMGRSKLNNGDWERMEGEEKKREQRVVKSRVWGWVVCFKIKAAYCRLCWSPWGCENLISCTFLSLLTTFASHFYLSSSSSFSFFLPFPINLGSLSPSPPYLHVCLYFSLLLLSSSHSWSTFFFPLYLTGRHSNSICHILNSLSFVLVIPSSWWTLVLHYAHVGDWWEKEEAGGEFSIHGNWGPSTTLILLVFFFPSLSFPN